MVTLNAHQTPNVSFVDEYDALFYRFCNLWPGLRNNLLYARLDRLAICSLT